MVCSVLLLGGPAAEGLCGSRECMELKDRAELAVRAKMRSERLVDVNRRMEVEQSRIAADEGIADAGSYRLTVIPSLQRPLTKMPRARRERFSENLASIIRSVFVQQDASTPADGAGAEMAARGVEDSAEDVPAADAAAPYSGMQADLLLRSKQLFAAACALCGGKCCQNGGEHAYISAETIRRFAARHPEARPDEIAEAYLCRVPQETFEDSCVYHSEHGCALPSEMRSATCNAYYCGGLQELHDHLSEGGPPRAFFVAAEDLQIAAMQFVKAEEAEEGVAR